MVRNLMKQNLMKQKLMKQNLVKQIFDPSMKYIFGRFETEMLEINEIYFEKNETEKWFILKIQIKTMYRQN